MPVDKQAESGLRDAHSLRERLKERERERAGLLRQIEQSAMETPAVPDIPDFEAAYEDVIRDLRVLLSSRDYVHRANEALAKLIGRVDVVPNPEARDGWEITIRGDLGLILQAISASERGLTLSEALLDLASQTSLVAGACNHLKLRLLSAYRALLGQSALAWSRGLLRSAA